MAGTLTKLPWYGQVGAFLGLSAAGVAAFFYLYAAPMQEEMTQRQRKLDALQTDIRKSQAIAQRLPQFRAEVADLEMRLETLKNVLPEEKDMGDLLRRLQTLAVQSNLTIRVFKPAPVVTKALHAEWPINIELDGTYHNLGLFYDRISRFSRIINIGNMSIKAKDKPDQNTSVAVACVATTFVLLDKPSAAKPGAKPAAGAPKGT